MSADKNSNKELWDDSHRTWPLPNLPWTMKQNWHNLLFAHYPVKLDDLRRLVPEVLPLDSFNGMGWVGVVPFEMKGVRLRGLPRVKGTDQFPELNVRTYVSVDGKPGVYFFSLEASNKLAVWSAQTFYHLPYKRADMTLVKNDSTIEFESKRRNTNDFNFACNYRPTSEPFYAKKGTFEEWMSERYCLYTTNKKGVPLRCDILHQPWQLQNAEAEFKQNTMLYNQGILVADENPILYFSKKIEVRTWPLVRALE
ncbi:DUF2071 domain-containing protein [Aquibacillus koreensis]|uniref:DUF2071 domain-containing protein n=1 Tax=Aquibacillus koreensis TaxID=279446 RepID=A0A9X4AJF4_9BACI|nr:DUF2071 domain-containing protein [Aquibacillus koreensis]MCT2536862.1 DUF2071 domain-containing protein [Aquibacillus koreensis]MDC3422006.1 DUF2071 domain-containing protein [Aquibacillus koreensis]